MIYSELRTRYSVSHGHCVIGFNVRSGKWEKMSPWYTTYDRLYKYYILPRKLPIGHHAPK